MKSSEASDLALGVVKGWMERYHRAVWSKDATIPGGILAVARTHPTRAGSQYRSAPYPIARDLELADEKYKPGL